MVIAKQTGDEVYLKNIKQPCVYQTFFTSVSNNMDADSYSQSVY